jgi:hypothetical protein
MLARTRFLCRLLGPFVLIVATGEMTQPAAMLRIAGGFFDDPGLVLLSGIITVPAGLAIVLVHNIWRGGAAPVIVTLLGWILLIKGTALLVIPSEVWVAAVHASHYGDLLGLYVALPLLPGAWLVYAGYFSPASRRQSTFNGTLGR